MTDRRQRVLAGVLLLVLVPFAVGCAGVGMAPSASVTTAIQGWEHYLSLDWTAQPQPNGQQIDGYIYNKYGQPMVNVQVLAQALDASGNVVGQKLQWVQGSVPGLQRAYFRVAVLPPAPQYRVSVWSFDILDSSNGGEFM